MPYRFAIIGCGQTGLRHAILALRLGRLLAVADILPEKAQKFANQLNTKGYDYPGQELDQPGRRMVNATTALQPILISEKIYAFSPFISQQAANSEG